MSSRPVTFLSRTAEGYRALTRAVNVSGRPERVAFLAAATGATVATALGHTRVTGLTRPLLPSLLAASVVREAARSGFNQGALGRGTRGSTDPLDTAGLLLGLSAATVGELLATRSPDRVRAAAAVTALSDLAYLGILSRAGARITPAEAAPRAAVVAAGAAAATRTQPADAPLVAGSGASLAALSASAQDRALVRGTIDPTNPRFGVSHGANLLFASRALAEGATAAWRRNRVAGALVGSLATATASVGHLLLADGLHTIARRG